MRTQANKQFRKNGLGRVAGIVLLVVLGICSSTRADTHTWKGGIGAWTDDAQWTNGAPLAGGDAVIARGTATLASASADLASFSMKGGMLIFTGLEACVRSVEVSITNGTVTHVANSVTATNADGTWAVDGRIKFSCTNFTLKAPGKIDVDAKGYQCPGANSKGYGPGGGGAGISATSKGGGGGGHGSPGVTAGAGAGGPANGSAYNPGPGSAGGGCSKAGGNGGGLVRIEASNGTVTVSGTITANGGTGASGGRGGGGSGGGIFIGCRVLAGSNGAIQANAGDFDGNGGPGGSGRIAISVDPAAQAAAPKSRITFSAKRSTTSYSGTYSDIGTISFSDIVLFDAGWMPHVGVLVCSSFTNWTVNELNVTNGWLRFPNLTTVFPLTVSNALTVSGGSGILQLYKPEIRCGSLTLNSGAGLYVYSTTTNMADGGPDYGALVAVSNDMIVGPTCWVFPSSDSTNGGSALFRMANLDVAAGGGFNADNLGFLRGVRSGNINYSAYGPGRGYPDTSSGGGTGAGYGGRGGRTASQPNRGAVYGDELQPGLPGSGGGPKGSSGSTCQAGNGGGLLRIESSGEVTLNGTLTANGQDGVSYGGGGSGGGIFVKCSSFSGASSGRMFAKGGDGWNPAVDGAGGGGRIAIWYGPWNTGEITPDRLVDHETNAPAAFAGAASLIPGAGYSTDAESGTLHYVEVLKESSGTLMIIR